MVDRHDLIILGTGVGGAEVAVQAARNGLDVLAIEQRLVGGECPYWGCIPSKAMARASSVLGEAARVGQLAGKSAVEPDWTVVASRVAEVSEHWDDARAADRLERSGATLLRGSGQIVGPAEVVVGGRRLAARKGLVIATGTQPAIPSIDGLPGVPYWTNREAVEAGAVPRSLIVLGAGAVGLELAQAFGRFGAEVTVVEAAEHALPMEEPENAAAIDEALRRDGITLITGQPPPRPPVLSAASPSSCRTARIWRPNGSRWPPGDGPTCPRSASPSWASTRAPGPFRPMRTSARATACGRSGT